MSPPLYYLISLPVIAIISLLLNARYKWVTKKHVNEEMFFMFLIILMLWPLAILLLTLAGLGYLAYKYIIPD